MAGEILLQENYPEEKIDLIKKCILNHRGSRLVDKTSPEEICVADKLERSYNKMSDKGKMLVKKQYDSAKNILT